MIPALAHEHSFSSWTSNRQKTDQEFVNIYEIFCKKVHEDFLFSRLCHFLWSLGISVVSLAKSVIAKFWKLTVQPYDDCITSHPFWS